MPDKQNAAELTAAAASVVLIGLLSIVWGIRWLATLGDNKQSKFGSHAESIGIPAGSSPLIEATAQVKKFQQKREALAALLEKALAERDELVAKLREAGIHKAADLKGNPRGQKLAQSLAKLAAEIEGLERQLAAIDSAILDANAVVRHLEREQAGISDSDMRKLVEQLRDAEERMDGATKVETPLDVEAALDKALKGVSSKSTTTNPAKNESRLVGKWEFIGRGPVTNGTLEFTRGGTALAVWNNVIPNVLGQTERRATLKYTLTGNLLTLTEARNGGERVDIEVEPISDEQMIFINRKNSRSFDWIDGRARRVD